MFISPKMPKKAIFPISVQHSDTAVLSYKIASVNNRQNKDESFKYMFANLTLHLINNNIRLSINAGASHHPLLSMSKLRLTINNKNDYI
jgi:hypothetical protein